MTDITISDVTNATATNDGTGAFDVLMSAVELRIEQQFKKQRLSATDFATVYLGAMQSVLQQSIQFALTQEKAGNEADTALNQSLKILEEIDTTIGQTAKVYAEIGLLGQKQITELAETTDPTGGLKLSQKLLFDAQIKGFEGKHENELLKIYLDTWAVIYSINDGDLAGTEFGIPSFVLEASPTVTLPPIIDQQALDSSSIY
jgi:hypothetical protein